MKFLVIVLIVRVIIKAARKKPAKEKMDIKRNPVHDPAAFPLR